MKILVAEDNADNLDVLKRRLERRGHIVDSVGDGLAAVEAAEQLAPDVILMDISMPILSGYEAMQRIRANPESADIPIIAVTAHAMDADRHECLRAGFNGFIPKPVDFNQLRKQLELLVTHSEDSGAVHEVPPAASAYENVSYSGHILVVDDSETNREVIRRRLSKVGYTIHEAEGGHEALEMIGKDPFDVMLLDLMMPHMSGMEVIAHVRKRYGPSELPIIMVTAKSDDETTISALDAGANDFVLKPVKHKILIPRIQTQMALKKSAAAIRSLNADLEARVEERTREWQTINESLREEIIQREAIETELKSAKEKAEESNHLKSQFLANMSHEIRTPMNGVLGMCQLLQRTKLTERQSKYSNTIRHSADALLSIINNILDISKIEAGLLDLKLEVFSLEELVDDARSVFISAATQKDIDLNLILDDECRGNYFGDAGRLRQILVNLMGNAIKFTEIGGVTLIVESTAKGGCRFTVKDSGPGLHPDELKMVFERFRQTDGTNTRKHGGTGLGLAISRELVELMGGEMDVRSTYGEGAEFWFEIELQPVSDMDTNDEVDALFDDGLPEVEILAGKNILLAEDSKVNYEVIQSLLEDTGCTLTWVENGAEALSKIEQEVFDLVLMDIQMPIMTGEEAIRKIRASQKNYAEIPIIAITANAMSGTRDMVMEAGANAYLSKPFELSELEELVLGLLQSESNRTAA